MKDIPPTAAVGPASQATATGGLGFTARQIPLAPDPDLLDWTPVPAQTLSNLQAGPARVGTGMDDGLTVPIHLDDIEAAAAR